jgi:hypothetical protein
VYAHDADAAEPESVRVGAILDNPAKLADSHECYPQSSSLYELSAGELAPAIDDPGFVSLARRQEKEPSRCLDFRDA